MYTCSMHPEVVSDVPGKCPKCGGMDLVEIVQGHKKSQDHRSHHQAMAEDFKKRFFIALVFAVPVLILSPTIQQWFGFSLPSFSGQEFLLFALASIIALYTAWPFYKSAWQDEILKGQWGMMTLVSLAVLSGYLYSGATTFLIEAPDFYWEISTLVLVLLLGHWMEMRAVIGASGALGELAKLVPQKANLVKQNNEIVEIETSKLKVGDVVLVRPGDKVPIDGAVIEGTSSVNESMITGESKPVAKKTGSEVIGGTVNEEGSLRVRVNKTGEDTALSQIIELVRKTQESKPPTQRLADKAAHWLTIAAIVAGVLTFITWNFIFPQGFVFALTLTITVIVIACPHALGLAIPTVTTITTALAAKNGILIRDMEGLEIAKNIDYVVFDKTGTLTKGEFGVSDVVSVGQWDERRVLQAAASVDQHSNHVIAQGIVKKAKEQGISFLNVKDYRIIAGKGGIGFIDEEVYVGNLSLIQAYKIEVGSAQQKAQAMANEGKTIVYVATADGVQGLLSLSDIIREESKEAVASLHSLGIKTAMLTGDNKQTAEYVAKEVGVDTYFAQVLPAEKINKVKELQEQGNVVMMVGDGVNDAPALIQADVGVAIGAGTDVAVESAEIVLMKNSPLDIVKLIRLSKKTMAKMKQNLVWATGYNLIAIPIAAGVLYPFGVILRPEWGALVMSASSIIVVFNALLLRRVKL